MKISSRGQYGLRALAVLAKRHGRGPTQVREIARAESLSAKYLEQLLGRLRAGGLVTSVRGARGGYQLARVPQAITVREVLVVLEGSLAPVGCVDLSGGCEGEGSCTAHAVWAGLHETVLAYLGSHTLANLVERPSERAEAASPEALAGAPDDQLAPAGARG
jgi:Rrf2 family protein